MAYGLRQGAIGPNDVNSSMAGGFSAARQNMGMAPADPMTTVGGRRIQGRGDPADGTIVDAGNATYSDPFAGPDLSHPSVTAARRQAFLAGHAAAAGGAAPRSASFYAANPGGDPFSPPPAQQEAGNQTRREAENTRMFGGEQTAEPMGTTTTLPNGKVVPQYRENQGVGVRRAEIQAGYLDRKADIQDGGTNIGRTAAIDSNSRANAETGALTGAVNEQTHKSTLQDPFVGPEAEADVEVKKAEAAGIAKGPIVKPGDYNALLNTHNRTLNILDRVLSNDPTIRAKALTEAAKIRADAARDVAETRGEATVEAAKARGGGRRGGQIPVAGEAAPAAPGQAAPATPPTPAQSSQDGARAPAAGGNSPPMPSGATDNGDGTMTYQGAKYRANHDKQQWEPL